MQLLMVIAACLQTTAPATGWHHPLYLGNGGLWRQRVPIVVTNRSSKPLAGTTVAVTVGHGKSEVPLAGARIGEIRVCNERGVEVLLAVADATGNPVRTGRMEEGMTLTLPIECPAEAGARYYIYFDNPRSWAPPDFLEATGTLRNGSVEDGQGDTPAGWVHDAGDNRHRASWTEEDAHLGRRCLKLEVAGGAEPTWIATRQLGLQIVGGARYRMTAWVKASRVQGYAGWYIHLGNLSNPMIEAPMLSAGPGTYDWKQVTLEFTAPSDADRADLGTVLWGTGTAWFDDVQLELLDSVAAPTVQTLPVERFALHEVGTGSPWLNVAGKGSQQPRTRVPIRLVNLSDRPFEGFASVPASMTGRLGAATGRSPSVAIADRGKVLPHFLVGDVLLTHVRIPPRSVLTLHAYRTPTRSGGRPVGGVRAKDYAPNPAVPGGMNRSAVTMDPAQCAALLASPLNLVKNPSFEEGESLPAHWPGGAEGGRPAGTEMGIVNGGLFGKRCVRVHIPEGSQRAWTGWRQDVVVQPNRTYLLAAWLRCENLDGGLQLHVHLRKENGDLVGQNAMTGAGPAISGTTGWTLMAGIFRTPEECRRFQIHLTMLANGTAWHDGVLLLEVASAETLTPEVRTTGLPALAVWPVNPIVKVFKEDVPPSRTSAPQIRISCAANEYEPVQIALRSSRDIRGLRVVMDPPRKANGAMLREWEIGVVGYVPVDAVTNYYSDRTPPYYRKIPRGAPGSDGWPGWWPDPILPYDRFDLEAGQTQPVWLTLHVPPATQAGVYRGRVRFVVADKTLAALPLTVRVRGFSLPDKPSLKAIYDCRQSGPMWSIPGKTESQTREDFWRFMAKHRLCPDTIKPEPLFTYKDGHVTADFSEFDRAGRIYFDELKFPHAYTPWHFYLFGWGHLPGEKFGEKPYEGTYPYEGVDRSKLRPEYKRAYQAFLRVFWDHVKAMGWADRFVLYISDEPHDSQPAIRAQMRALCDMIHEVDSRIPIYCSTWHHQPEWDGKLDVWGIGHYGIVSVAKMEELKAGGARIWWTTDGQMCTDTPYCAIERLLPHYCFEYGAEAYEFWGVDWLTYDPYRYGWHAFLLHDFGVGMEKEYVRYPNGDGFLAYPPGPKKFDRPVPSVRLEQAREGVEDYEYLVLLRNIVARGKAAGREVGIGEAALRKAGELVSSPCEIGRYSTRILPDPDRVLRVREAVANAIEKLGAVP